MVSGQVGIRGADVALRESRSGYVRRTALRTKFHRYAALLRLDVPDISPGRTAERARFKKYLEDQSFLRVRARPARLRALVARLPARRCQCDSLLGRFRGN